MMRTPLSRRTVLKGLGAAIALPFLEAMLPRHKSAEVWAGENVPLRAAFLSMPNGFWMDSFTPKTAGKDFELPATLKVLSAVKDDITVVSGLALDNARAKGDGGGDHARSAAAFLTGTHPFKTSGRNIKLNVSIDQVIAKNAGQSTRLPSLEIGCDSGQRAGDCDSGYSCAYVTNISWANEAQPLPKLVDPALVFDRLFTSSMGDLKSRGSILDYTAGELNQLNTQVSSADRRKLDEFTTSIREVERRIQQEQNMPPPKPPANFPRPDGIPDDFETHARLMADLMVLAFRMDITRVITFMLAREGSNRTYPNLGVNNGHHEVSHHGHSPEKVEAIKKINKFHMTQVGYLLEKLKATKDGGAPLLDRCMIMAGSGIGDGDAHNHDNLPILLAGKANGAWNPGRHVKMAKETPLCNVYVSMLQNMGIKSERFGDSTGPLKELVG